MPTKSNNTGGRGGTRPGAGRKKTAVREKLENGNPGGRKLEVLDIPEVEGVDMPKPHDFLSAEQRDGSTLQAEDIYAETWRWLKKIGCASKVSPQLLERYAMCSARWIQCEEMTNKMGFPQERENTDENGGKNHDEHQARNRQQEGRSRKARRNHRYGIPLHPDAQMRLRGRAFLH